VVIKDGIKTFKVHVSPHHKLLVFCNDIETAKIEAWRGFGIEPGYYHYGWAGWYDFKNNVLVEEVF
jgi:hypothetical protein